MAPIDSDKPVNKAMYIITFWEGKMIREKIEKICDSFNGQRFVLPARDQLGNQISQVEGYIQDARANFDATRTNLRDQLVAFNNVEDKLERDDD
jgi:vacuolar-type H+-ATPase subunit I/STV1